MDFLRYVPPTAATELFWVSMNTKTGYARPDSIAFTNENAICLSGKTVSIIHTMAPCTPAQKLYTTSRLGFLVQGWIMLEKREVKLEEIDACPECGSAHIAHDYERGELVCKQCGLVIEDRYIEIRGRNGEPIARRNGTSWRERGHR